MGGDRLHGQRVARLLPVTAPWPMGWVGHRPLSTPVKTSPPRALLSPSHSTGEITLADPGMASPEAARTASQGINRGIVSPFRNSWSSDTHLAPMFLIRPAHSSETTVHAISSWLSKTTS